MKTSVFVGLLAALTAVRLVLMATVPVFEPSEARYAAISANMARSGDFVVPRFTHDLEYQSFDGKPPLVFQAGGFFCRVFGVCEFAVRLFPFLSAVLLLSVVFHAVRRISRDEDAARLAVVICASCTAFYAASGISMTDMTLTCCVGGALLLYRCFLDGFRLRYAAGVAALLGAGMITKGPVSIVMFGLPLLADAVVKRRWRGIFNRKWLVVVPVFLLVAVPWFVLVERCNPGSVWYFFYNENFMRFVSHDYGDKYGAGREAFRGVSVLWALVATLPWALVPLWAAVRARMHRDVASAENVLMAWNGRSFELLSLLAIVGFWCLTSRVLVYYLFPVIPLFAAWLALYGNRAKLSRLAPFAVAVTVAVVGGVLIGGTCCSDKMLGSKTPFEALENHYAHEFYHGRKSEAELAPYRKARDAYMKARAARKAGEAAAKKEHGE